MSPNAENILHAALNLSQEDRMELAERLRHSLDAAARESLDAAWGQEAERRVQAYKEGTLQAVDYDEAMRSIRQRLKR